MTFVPGVVSAPMSSTLSGPCLGCREEKPFALFDCRKKQGMCAQCVSLAQHGKIPITGDMLKLLSNVQVVNP